MYYLSVDGGGSKTAFLITDENGKAVAEKRGDGCSYLQIGIDGVVKVLTEGMDALLGEKGISRSKIVAAALGLPCFGEDPLQDLILSQSVKDALQLPQIHICNDVELGWAGSLGLEAGIHIVSGTGAIIYGNNLRGQIARANGWHEDFSDEGSGYWIGMRALSLYAKQLDGRMERTELYEKINKAMGLSSDDEFVRCYCNEYQGQRKKVASLQKVVQECALDGDAVCCALYAEAAQELASGVKAIARCVSFDKERLIPVSYSGGVFSVGALVLEPLKHLLDDGNHKLQEPLLSPIYGGILLAAEQISLEKAHFMKEILSKKNL